MAIEKDIQQLQTRVTNLEIALHAMWSLLSDLQPPHVQESVSAMLGEHYDESMTAGGFSRTHFDSES